MMLRASSGAVEQSIYNELYGTATRESKAAQQRQESARAVHSFEKQKCVNRASAADAWSGERMLRETKLRINEIYTSDTSRTTSGSVLAPTRWLVFSGRGADGRDLKWKGTLPKVDMLHEYTVLYRMEPDIYDPAKRVATIKKVIEARRAPFDKDIATVILDRVLRLDPAQVMQIRARMQNVQGNLGAFLRQEGDEAWLREAESRLLYFQDWYTEALCPPYEAGSLKYLRPESIEKIARIAVAEPWKLCFWWMTDVPLLEELDARQAEELARRYGGDFPESAKLAAAAYCGKPFGRARSRGDSYVPFAWFKDTTSKSVRDPRLLWACIHHQVARVVREEGDDKLRVYCTGDLRCEQEVAEMIIAAVTRSEGEEEDAAEHAPRMRPRSAWWPWKDPAAPRPTPEQQAAIDMVMHSRLGVVCGKPGTGKTAMVMRALFSAYTRGQCVGVSFTGMAAQNQRTVAGYGVTAHKIVNEWRKAHEDHIFSGRKVLVIEESSAISMRLLHAVLVALRPSLTRIYFFGDYRQMPPPDGGPSILEALVTRYHAATAVVSELATSMRVTDASGVFVRNLDRICGYNLAELEWTRDPAAGHPFVFLKRGCTPAENVAIIRDALSAAGIDPDSRRAQVMVRTNELRIAMARAWYDASAVGKAATARGIPYAEHEFSVGERVMFLRNSNTEYKPYGSAFKCGRVMNGTTGTIAEIFDEDSDQPAGSPTTAVTNTRAPRSAKFRRWLRIEPGDLYVLLDHYGKTGITRVPPVTIDKMQGMETDYSVVMLVKPVKHIGSRGMYSACSRGKLGCFVVADFDPAAAATAASAAPLSTGCPSRDFYDTIMASHGVLPRTDFWKRFPEYDTIREAIQFDP